ncbi:hypothetical protein Taro_022793 [Colocasia esculenta]|uniref:Retrotransposon gag domain-containing protein n=1 Tax=Colocasia esculenta TaxID=4460 RepID=A0A843V6E7_COLES|nr:hypothetical protein [Colocasia esculenta]
MQETVAGLTQALQNVVQDGNQADATARNGAGDLHCNFRSLNPPRFSGSLDPDEAENWQEEIERIFQVMQCTNREKVVLATFQFTKDARAWWKATSAHLPNVGKLQWAGFLEIFRGKYFSERVKEKKAEFLAAGEQEIVHTKPFFFPFSSAATCTHRPLEVDQSIGLLSEKAMGQAVAFRSRPLALSHSVMHGLQVWCWLDSTVLWLYCVVVERQLDLSFVTARLRGSSYVVLSGLDTGIMNQLSVPMWWRRSFQLVLCHWLWLVCSDSLVEVACEACSIGVQLLWWSACEACGLGIAVVVVVWCFVFPVRPFVVEEEEAVKKKKKWYEEDKEEEEVAEEVEEEQKVEEAEEDAGRRRRR